MDDGFVLLLQEVQFHPASYITRLDKRFELPSILHITRKEELRIYSKAPLFDDKYLVIFDSLRVMQDNKAYISFKYMFPVLRVETTSQLSDAKFYCQEEGIPFKIFQNEFTKANAMTMIQAQASEPVTDSVMKAIIRQVGLSPMRIITAIAVCEQMGYTVSVVERYVDKWIYPDLRKLIECLLGVPRSASAVRNAIQYLYINRHWYRYVKRSLLDELDFVLEVYKGKIEGELFEENLHSYSDEHHVTIARVMFSLKLFERVSITSVLVLREFIKNASLMEVVLRLS